MTTAVQASLIRQAHEHWDIGQPIPLDLFAQLAREGLDPSALEARHLNKESIKHV